MYDDHLLVTTVHLPFVFSDDSQPWPRRYRRKLRRHSRERVFHEMSRDPQLNIKHYDQLYPKGVRAHEILQIWHKEPYEGACTRCPRLSYKQRERIRSVAWSEHRDPSIILFGLQEWPHDHSKAEAESRFRALLLHVADAAEVRLSFGEAARIASVAIWSADACPVAGRLCFKHKYHTNSTSVQDCIEYLTSMFCSLLEWYVLDRRWRITWRWHFWHWRFSVPPLLHFKRWLFSRCEKCGKGFSYGYCPVSYSWDGSGPRWFRGEPGVVHHDCTHPADYNVSKEVQRCPEL